MGKVVAMVALTSLVESKTAHGAMVAVGVDIRAMVARVVDALEVAVSLVLGSSPHSAGGDWHEVGIKGGDGGDRAPPSIPVSSIEGTGAMPSTPSLIIGGDSGSRSRDYGTRGCGSDLDHGGAPLSGALVMGTCHVGGDNVEPYQLHL